MEGAVRSPIRYCALVLHQPEIASVADVAAQREIAPVALPEGVARRARPAHFPKQPAVSPGGPERLPPAERGRLGPAG